MGEGFFCTSVSETKSGKRATHFEPLLSLEVYLERCLCEQEPLKMRCRYDEPLLRQYLFFVAGRSISQAEKVHRKSASHRILSMALHRPPQVHPLHFSMPLARRKKRGAKHSFC